MTLIDIPAALGSETPGVLALCFAMTLALLWYIFYIPEEIAAATDKSRATFLRERKEAVYENLRDLNFEYKAGKVAEDDYQEMRASLEDEAAALLAEIESLEGTANASGFALRTPSPKGARK